MTSNMKAPRAEANRSMAEVENTAVSLSGILKGSGAYSCLPELTSRMMIMFNACLQIFRLLRSIGRMIPTLRLSYVKMLLFKSIISPKLSEKHAGHPSFRKPVLYCLHLAPVFLPIRFAVLLAGMVFSAVLLAQSTGGLITQEYFVQQSADEDLLITIHAFEAEFESQITDQGGAILLDSGIPGSRIAPVFQYVTAPDKNRQLDIRVTSSLHTMRSEVGLELTRFKVWDNRSKSLARAYDMLSFGMLSNRDASAASWTVKIDSLINAGRLFRQFGMQEMRLWSNYLAAHMIQFHLNDYSIVYSMTREILAELKGVRLQKIELATLHLQSAALIGLKKAGMLSKSADGADPVQAALSRSASLAASMGYYFGQAQALSLSGAEYASDSLYPEALEKFQQAVMIADSVGDGEFATGIRERIVQIHSIQGDAQASSEVLQKIETQLVEEGTGDDLALNLLAQGRLLVRNFNYDPAAGILYQALEHQNDSAIRRQINFELAKIFYETGRLEEALAYLKLVGIKPEVNPQTLINPVVDMGEALEVMASIHRARGDYAAMNKARIAQNRYRSERAWYLYEQGLDQLAAAGNSRSRAALALFRRAYSSASSSAQVDLQHLVRLQICALAQVGDSLCSQADIKASYESLMNGGVPRIASEAMYVQAKILVAKGQQAEAIAVLDRLVSEIHMFRYSLPGVLGAWYRERHEQLFEFYLNLLASTSSPRGRADGLSSLLALSKIRYIEKHDGVESNDAEGLGDTNQLRTLLAQRAGVTSGQNRSALTDQINRGMADIRQSFESKFDYLSDSGLQRFLQNLEDDEIVLTYHISPTTAQVWIGTKGRVERRNIENPAYIYSALQEARQGLGDVGISAFNSKMDSLGRRLAAPIANLLPERIYWVPAGPLLGFPLDALRLSGHYLLEKHTVINLLSFPGNVAARAGLRVKPPGSVFLAGHPQDYSGDIATRLDTSPEIQAVTDIFVGPGLHIIQGFQKTRSIRDGCS
jgi:tetratricopeptide (TPR) repeat protein